MLWLLTPNEFDINFNWQQMSVIYLKTNEDILGYKKGEEKRIGI